MNAIAEQLRTTLDGLDHLIAGHFRAVESLNSSEYGYDLDPFQSTSRDGVPVLAPLYAAKAQVLIALAGLE